MNVNNVLITKIHNFASPVTQIKKPAKILDTSISIKTPNAKNYNKN